MVLGFRQIEALAQPGREVRAEAEAPAPDVLVADHYALLSQDQLGIAQAQAERMVEPDDMMGDRSREAVARGRWEASSTSSQLGPTSSFRPVRNDVTMTVSLNGLQWPARTDEAGRLPIAALAQKPLGSDARKRMSRWQHDPARRYATRPSMTIASTNWRSDGD